MHQFMRILTRLWPSTLVVVSVLITASPPAHALCSSRISLPRGKPSSSHVCLRTTSTVLHSFVATLEKDKTEVSIETSILVQEAPLLSCKSKHNRVRDVEFMSPLLKYGYRPAVVGYETGRSAEKPLLLYLPGFDGTFLSPFLQFPELETTFDVRCMVASPNDRSTYEELKTGVIDFLESVTAAPSSEESDNGSDRGNLFQRLFNKNKRRRPIYLTGESFGGILALDVALTILQTRPDLDLQGLCVINAATCYDRSRLAAEAPAVAQYPPFLYTVGLLKLLPLFMDEFSLDQLLLILRAEALPSVIDNEAREAYLGRVALSLPFIIPFMNQGVLQWRLTEWLSYGCNLMLSRLSEFANFKSFRTLIVAGEKDATLPSIDEAERLASLLPAPSTLHVVKGAGHASTCGARVDLAALFRLAFPELRQKGKKKYRTSMKEIAASGEGAVYGMEPRYDNATIGLNPLRYWDKAYFRRHIPSILNATKMPHQAEV